MNDNDLNNHQFDALMMDEARVRWVQQRAAICIELAACRNNFASPATILDWSRAPSAKGRLLESFGLKNPCLQNAGLTETQLLRWYFEELLGRPVPD